jgi:hypothetical protein
MRVTPPPLVAGARAARLLRRRCSARIWWWGARTRHVSTLVAALALTIAACGGSDRNSGTSVVGPPATVEPYIQARPWASSKANGQAFGRIWREQTRDPRDRDGRGMAAYDWAIRTCDAVRQDGQTPQTMVQRVRHEAQFSTQGAKVIVTAALQALCPDQGTPSQLRP